MNIIDELEKMHNDLADMAKKVQALRVRLVDISWEVAEKRYKAGKAENDPIRYGRCV